MEPGALLCAIPQTPKAFRKKLGSRNRNDPHKENNMTNARIERMLRELNSEPPVQFFQDLFGLVGLGESRESSQPQPSLAAKPVAA